MVREGIEVGIKALSMYSQLACKNKHDMTCKGIATIEATEAVASVKDSAPGGEEAPLGWGVEN